MAGLEDLLEEEIVQYGGVKTEKLKRAVSFEGDLASLYRVNYCSRLALRVLYPILQFRAHNETVLYKRLRRFDWTSLLDINETFRVNALVNSDKYRNSHYISLKTKDAIVDQFREKYNSRRPSIDLEHPDLIIDVYCNGLDFVISLDSSGDSLHKRGYRQSHRLAPLNEVLAAGMIAHSGWDPESEELLDPMCGTGTLLIEAYMKAKNIPPQYHRERFAFMSWPRFDRSLWHKVKKAVDDNVNDTTPRIIGFDINRRQIEETQRGLDFIGYKEIKITNTDFLKADAPSDKGTMITNPPYGLRVEHDDILQFYKEIGDTLKQKYAGWSAWILSGNKEAIKSVGLRTGKRLTLFNGPIECKYHRYDLYKGTQKK